MNVRETSLGRAAIAALCLLCCGCAFFTPELPPFHYVSVEVRKGAAPPAQLALGIVYRIINTGEQTITAVHIAFWAFDADGKAVPAVGRNYVQAAADVDIAAGAEAEICTSLDNVFYYVPSGDLQISSFRVTSVDLGDGTSWTDPFARFPYPGPVPTVEVDDAQP
jgi:hypothetical protein